MRIGRLIIVFILACIVSLYLFPIELTFLPAALNTKRILAVFGILFFVLSGRSNSAWTLTRPIIISAVIAVAFSIWCYFSTVVNNTDDTSYSTYFVSYAVWLGGAMGVYGFLSLYHKKVDLALLTKYLAAVCVAQCILALMIDNIPTFKVLVDSYVRQGQEFYDEVNRLYGIGASLDPAGVRFSVVLVLLAHQISKNSSIIADRRRLALYIAMFLTISVVGNMIARTTSAGMFLGLFYIAVNSFMVNRHKMSKAQLRTIGVFAVMLFIAVVFMVYLYNTNKEARQLLRFAFEGFFNWVETGEFSTGSTDKLNATMWIWPTTTDGWIWGTGLFDGWVYGTDIGYCRFTLYCGLVGLVIFSLFFVYDSLAMMPKFKDSQLLFFLLLSLTFIIWVKVATDIFFIYALFFCIEGDDEEEIVEEMDIENLIEEPQL